MELTYRSNGNHGRTRLGSVIDLLSLKVALRRLLRQMVKMSLGNEYALKKLGPRKSDDAISRPHELNLAPREARLSPDLETLPDFTWSTNVEALAIGSNAAL